MDILTCTVGIMLFVVIFTLLESGGATFEMNLPMLKKPPQNLRGEMFVCSGGEIKYFPGLNQAVSNSVFKVMDGKKITYDNLPKIIDLANRMKYKDKYFSYEFECVEEPYGFMGTTRLIKVIVKNINTIKANDSKTINTKNSYFVDDIKSINRDNSWVLFLVDNESLEVFKKARKIASEKGLKIGWEPIDNNFFPFEYIIRSGEGKDDGGIGVL